MEASGAESGTAISIETCTGAALAGLTGELAALRLAVFREWPYLYEGSVAYEADYLDAYVRSPRAAIIVARQADRIVGAATCVPLADEADHVQAPFVSRGWDTKNFFYFGESVLLPGLRGRGLGVRFFEAREAHARAVSGCRFTCFCSVVRPDDHPERPPGWVSLDAFWSRRGYTRRPELVCRMDWTDAGQPAATPHELVFWLKSLTGAPLP